jgi:hypothetical protein
VDLLPHGAFVTLQTGIFYILKTTRAKYFRNKNWQKNQAIRVCLFVKRKVRYSALFTNLGVWSGGMLVLLASPK